ncbi:MAG TPA: methyltransferase domain-containing protein [Bryobacteraceae bacterium]|nr:methyltransferase domain-containing protein [Bryobacteraceae bacterium]
MQLDWGSLRRAEPVSRQFGFDRGVPVDRYYIEQFLRKNAGDVRGRVLEIGDDSYTRQFGGDRVKRSDVFHAHAENPLATFVGDLATADEIPSGILDCAIVTQTLQCVFEPGAAIRTLYRILRPGGVLLLTVPGITAVSSKDDEWSKMWYWSFTPALIRHLVLEAFEEDLSTFEVRGNVLTGVCALQGIALEDIRVEELERDDPEYPVLLCARAVKRAG